MDKQITLRDLLYSPGSIPVSQLLLFATITVFLILMVYLQTRKDHLDLRYLILDKNKNPSIHKIGQMVALIVSTWGFVVLTSKGTLSEGYFFAYMATWSGSVALESYFSRNQRGPDKDNERTEQ